MGASMKASDRHPEFSAELVKMYLRHRLIYSIGGLALGLICVLGGMILFLKGISGSTSWTASLLGLNSKINDAAPGSVLFVVGIFLVFITKHKVDVEFASGKSGSRTRVRAVKKKRSR